jgi:hypothetical protein
MALYVPGFEEGSDVEIGQLIHGRYKRVNASRGARVWLDPTTLGSQVWYGK